MWYEIYKFELKYRVKRADTYLFFTFLFLFSIVGVDFVFQGVELGQVKINAPIVIAKTMAAITGIFMIMASMIMGVPVLRDFEYHIESLMLINPIKKQDYLFGRFLGSFAVLLFVFSGVLWGMVLGEYVPWRNPDDLMPFRFLTYLQPFLFLALPILVVGACLFFVTGALSRKLIVVYTQGIIFFVVFMLTKAISNEFLQAIFDPFSLVTLTVSTEYWTAIERNSMLIPFTGVLLYNKLFWLIVAIVVSIFGYSKFNFNIVKDRIVKGKSKTINDTKKTIVNYYKIPNSKLQRGFKTQVIQLMEHAWFYCKSILKENSFWAVVICGMIIILINSVSLGTVHGVDSYPATHFIVEELQEMSIYFFVIILVFYSGELIWKERGVKLDLIYDATPISNFINLAGKYMGLLLIYSVLMVSLILSGILFQTLNGYYHYELDVYFYGFFLEILPFLALYTLIAFFTQVIINKKFVGIIAVLAFFILNVSMEFFGFKHDLYMFGGNSLGTYSSMNGYGHYLTPYLIVKAYWFIFGIILLIVASVLSVRGTETHFIKRLKGSRGRMSKSLLKMGGTALIIFLVLGSFIFYNTNILNEYWTDSQERIFRAGYEKTLKNFEYLPQPKIMDVNLKVELYPENRSYTVEGYYLLTNARKEPIDEIHVQKLIDSQVDLDYVAFENETLLNTKYKQYDYYIYELSEPLETGDFIKMKFKQTFTTKGFEEGGSNIKVVKNGTFFNNQEFPTLGYNRKYELTDNDMRIKYGLSERIVKAKINDLHELTYARTGSDSDGITFEIIIGTKNNQTAIAPGVLQKKWMENDRAYFHYKLNKPIVNFYSIVSARYEIMKDQWVSSNKAMDNLVDLEIYYHKGHEYNLDRMMESMKLSLNYFSNNFSPYQYKQMRIMEFPRYREFAQSFPNTVPFSEAIGFVLDINDNKDVDMAFYITAHELAHQWWGLQVEAANVQGRNMILESLAQYSALMVFKEKYPDQKVEQFLQMQLEAYRIGKMKDKNKEVPMAFVENQNYIYYNKGALAMFALQNRIGEDNVNLALRRFIQDWHTHSGKIKTATNKYATTENLLGFFKEVTPDSLQHIITDLFERTDSEIENNLYNR